mgnify:CR=1 FL=1
MLCALMSAFMACAWAGIAWFLVPDQAFLVGLIVFLVMFGVVVRTEVEDD